MADQPLPMPRTTNPHAAKIYRALAKPYDAIADIFRSGDGQRLRAEFEYGSIVWNDVGISHGFTLGRLVLLCA